MGGHQSHGGETEMETCLSKEERENPERVEGEYDSTEGRR